MDITKLKAAYTEHGVADFILDIYGHVMAGFDKQKTAESLNLDADRAAFCIIALGYLGNIDQLNEPYKGRELMSRTMKPLSEFVFK